ncbi:allantoate permease [Macroventuria anomochaeta]|uniref:Allantoate permease n=1 Tax=Macroventuria anomochaeta TaxID=301207 RepID=A0ACB6RYI4_9PLEO|nr:allantoate permease [Macroventuria anomochaeta]KAF2627095.1 allantoate permease [Macroventuria anomochaeta]
MDVGDKSPKSDREDEIDETVETLTKAQLKRLMLKTDLVIMPLAIVCLTIAFLEKNALGYAAKYSWLDSIFYFRYLAMKFPTLWLITRFPVGTYVGICLTPWGACLCFLVLCHNFTGLATVRFITGMLEAATLLCMMLINAMWCPPDKHSLRTAFWHNTFPDYIFLIYGAFNLLLGILFFFAMPESPAKAWFFNAEEKRLAAIRLAPTQTGIESRKHLAAPITNFNSLTISGYGFGKTKTLLMATPQAAVAMVASATLTAVSMYVPKVRCFFWIFGATMYLIGAVMVHTLHFAETRNVNLAGAYLMGFYNVSWVLTLSLSSSNTGGATKKIFMGITCAVMYAVGNIIGPQFFISSQSPTHPLGIGAILVAFTLMAITGVVYCALCIFENKRRDRLYGVAQDEAAIGLQAERDDLTDRQNLNFRYTY